MCITRLKPRRYWISYLFERFAKRPFREKSKTANLYYKRGIVVVEKKDDYLSLLQKELGHDDQKFWFDFRQKKFLHNIDTFYYSVKLTDDFTVNTKDWEVLQFRSTFESLRERMGFRELVPFYLESIGKNMNFLNMSYGKYYNVCLECPEYFHVFIASKVPPAADGQESVTCEIIVQIRSYMLWMYGIHAAFERSMEYVQAIVDQFGFHVAFVQENRIDYCWHSNYLTSPEKFFTIENFYKMRVDRYRGANFHTAKVGSEDYEVDYVSLGNRGGKCFVRIYLKSKEVVEQGYKAFFLKLWLFHGLISRYDLYCYEEAYVRRSWSFMTIARLQFYLEHGTSAPMRKRCTELIAQYDQSGRVTDVMLELADRLTPKVHLIVNVEYQTMRKGTKNYTIIPFRENRLKGCAERVYDYLDNRPLISEYLTRDIFRLVEPSGDSNKSRRDYCGFWKALRATRMIDARKLPDQLRLTRDYHRKLNKDQMKRTVLNKAVTFGIYSKGLNNDSPMKDCMDALLRINDNDIQDAIRYKQKKSNQFNEDELAAVRDNVVEHNFALIDQVSGEIYDYNNIQHLLSQDRSDKDE